MLLFVQNSGKSKCTLKYVKKPLSGVAHAAFTPFYFYGLSGSFFPRLLLWHDFTKVFVYGFREWFRLLLHWPSDRELQPVLLCCENPFGRCGRRGVAGDQGTDNNMFWVIAFALSAFCLDWLLAHQAQIGLTDE